MEEIRAELRKALNAALENRRRDDSLEQAVGREVRRAGLSYQDYMEIMETVRKKARRTKLDAWDSAKAISKEQKE
ncbi:MAG: hypothetical protein NT131_00060 [Methanomassiliicoccales archaeon]|nr:hypothetical protein [Methanomassiliicoccales archaeon]